MLHKFADETTYIECSATGRKYKIREETLMQLEKHYCIYITFILLLWDLHTFKKFSNKYKVFSQVSNIQHHILQVPIQLVPIQLSFDKYSYKYYIFVHICTPILSLQLTTNLLLAKLIKLTNLIWYTYIRLISNRLRNSRGSAKTV